MISISSELIDSFPIAWVGAEKTVFLVVDDGHDLPWETILASGSFVERAVGINGGKLTIAPNDITTIISVWSTTEVAIIC